MGFESVSFPSGSLLTSTKMSTMVDNDEFGSKRYGRVLWDYDLGLDSFGSGAYAVEVTGLIYIPASIDDSLTVKAEMKITGGGTGYLKLTINGAVDSTELTTTSSSWETVSGTIDVSTLSAGWYSLEVYGKTVTGNTESRAIIVNVTPE